MAKSKSVAYFVAVSDISKPTASQEGVLLEVEGRGGDTEKNRAKALEIVNQMWEKGDISADTFPDGITQENILFVPPDSPRLQQTSTEASAEPEVHPVVQGAQEIIQLTKLQIEVQEAAQEAAPYAPIVEAVIGRNRPLTTEEKDLARDKKFSKVIERMGKSVANQEEYQETCTGNGKLILNAITWQLQQAESVESENPSD